MNITFVGMLIILDVHLIRNPFFGPTYFFGKQSYPKKEVYEAKIIPHYNVLISRCCFSKKHTTSTCIIAIIIH